MTEACWPTTEEEWAEVIPAAVFCLGIHSAIAYGLVAWEGTTIDVDRAEAMLDQARQEGRPIPTFEEVVG